MNNKIHWNKKAISEININKVQVSVYTICIDLVEFGCLASKSNAETIKIRKWSKSL